MNRDDILAIITSEPIDMTVIDIVYENALLLNIVGEFGSRFGSSRSLENYHNDDYNIIYEKFKKLVILHIDHFIKMFISSMEMGNITERKYFHLFGMIRTTVLQKQRAIDKRSMAEFIFAIDSIKGIFHSSISHDDWYKSSELIENMAKLYPASESIDADLKFLEEVFNQQYLTFISKGSYSNTSMINMLRHHISESYSEWSKEYAMECFKLNVEIDVMYKRIFCGE